MKDRVNDDGIARRLVENLVRKAALQRAAQLVHGDRIELRMPLDSENTRLDAPEKILAESWLTALIPVVRLCNILLGLLGINDLLNHAAHVPDA